MSDGETAGVVLIVAVEVRVKVAVIVWVINGVIVPVNVPVGEIVGLMEGEALDCCKGLPETEFVPRINIKHTIPKDNKHIKAIREKVFGNCFIRSKDICFTHGCFQTLKN